jgi:hypothetical protein
MTPQGEETFHVMNRPPASAKAAHSVEWKSGYVVLPDFIRHVVEIWPRERLIHFVILQNDWTGR